ncbi:MAG: hypothetical protein RMN25_07330 [Anaerolineae bacterium]|nr:hypothetical protein [Thermoflexales bacterium]MDW8407581.1 hypothetical protein [Anaerolineae bacterium]
MLRLYAPFLVEIDILGAIYLQADLSLPLCVALGARALTRREARGYDRPADFAPILRRRR